MKGKFLFSLLLCVLVCGLVSVLAGPVSAGCDCHDGKCQPRAIAVLEVPVTVGVAVAGVAVHVAARPVSAVVKQHPARRIITVVVRPARLRACCHR